MNNNVLPTGSPLTGGWIDFFIVMGAILLVALAVLFWAIAFHKPGAKRKHHRKHRHRKHGNIRGDFQKTTAGIKEIIQQRQQSHRHRHEHHPLNPTLAQTGGLPPIREEPKSPPSTP